MSRKCKSSRSQQSPKAEMSKATKSINATAWEGHSNDKQFMEALSRFMNESWAAVCQIREKSGLNSQYEMSSTELSKRITEVSKKLDEKYQEVQALEAQKSQLMNKSQSAPGPSGAGAGAGSSPCPSSFQPVASSTPAQQQGYSGNYDMSYSGAQSGSSGWPSTTASSGGSSARRKLQFTQSSSSSSGCQPTCSGSSGEYQNFSGVDYGF